MGEIVSAIGGLEAGRTNKQYYNYLASENEDQSREILSTAREQKGLIYDTAARQTEALRQGLKSLGAKQKTAIVGSGISASSKTAEDIARSSSNVEAEDELAVRYNADMSAWSTMKQAKSQSNQLLSQAKGYRQAGENAEKAAGINAWVSLLGGLPKYFA